MDIHTPENKWNAYMHNILSRATSLGAPLYGGVRTWVEGQKGREETRQSSVHSHRNLPHPALISPEDLTGGRDNMYEEAQ